MLEGSVNRELEAVNSEFDKNLKNDFWRKSQIKKLLGNPKHDFNKFTCGNSFLYSYFLKIHIL